MFRGLHGNGYLIKPGKLPLKEITYYFVLCTTISFQNYKLPIRFDKGHILVES